MKSICVLRAVAALLGTAISAQANTIVYDFNDGTTQGWKNIRTSSAVAGYYDLSFGPATQTGHDNWGGGPNPIWSVTGGGVNGVPPTGAYFLGEIPFANQIGLTDWATWPAGTSGAQQSIMIQSPAFKLDGSGPLTYLGCGDSQDIPLLTTLAAIPEIGGTWGAQPEAPNLAESTKGNCAVGLLRDDGVFVLSKYFVGGGDSWATYTFTASQLAPFVNDGHTYTLNVVDFWSGKNAWCAIDNVNIPGNLLTPPAPTPGLTLNIALNTNKSSLLLTWNPISYAATNAISVVLSSDSLTKPLSNWTVVDVATTLDGSSETPLPATTTFFWVRQEETSTEFPQALQFGAPVQLELWHWGMDAASQSKIMDIHAGDQISGDLLPWDGVRYQFRVPVPHNSVKCRAYSSDCFDQIAWGPEAVALAGSESRLYNFSDAIPPLTGKYYVEVEARNNGQLVAKAIIPFSIVRAQTTTPDGLLGVGNTQTFPQPTQSGSLVEFQLWQWNDTNANLCKLLTVLTNGMELSAQSLPTLGMYFRFHVPVTHDTVTSRCYSSDCFDKIEWGPEQIPAPTPNLYRCWPWSFTFQVGTYVLSVEASNQGQVVAQRVIQFKILPAPITQNTHYTQGKTDLLGNPITFSEPVALGALNQTPVLIDNDYPFTPQHAYYSINWERFPPFQMPPRFVEVYGSRRFLDETNFGGPLSRGFKTLAMIDSSMDNLTIPQRNWFHTPDQQVSYINQWYAQDPVKYADLEAYALYRSAFVSETNAYKLGAACYDSWGAGGYAPYDPGIYGWDEEQMWPTIGIDMIRNHPSMVPQSILDQFVNDPQLTSPDSQALAQSLYIKAWGDFIGNGYKGARDCAAQRGRIFKVWHYGSHAPGDSLFLSPNDYAIDPLTGKPNCDELSTLFPWFKIGDRISFEACEYTRQIDFFEKDFYYMTIFPQTSSMYQKVNGTYSLDQNGRRTVRNDVFSETMYAAPVQIGYEDCGTSPRFLTAFLGKGENALYFLNGGNYYKNHGTFVTDKKMMPALRPSNQETWGQSAALGSRPISPFMAEAATIFTYMMGIEGLYLWDSHNYRAGIGQGPSGAPYNFGDVEFMVKGMHRISQFNSLFEGDYSFVRPFCHYNSDTHDHPLIRGIMNGRYLLMAMSNPYLDPGETQQVELWYGAPYAQKTAIWSGTVTLQARKNHLFQCQLPALPGAQYDPDKLYLRYTCVDGNYTKTYTLSGNYTVPYPY